MKVFVIIGKVLKSIAQLLQKELFYKDGILMSLWFVIKRIYTFFFIIIIFFNLNLSDNWIKL